MDLKAYIRTIPDFPKSGIQFYDISPLLSSPKAYRETIVRLAIPFEDKVDGIVSLDARGFLFGPTLAYRLRVPFAMARKKGKLPGVTVAKEYDLEYGSNTIELHIDALKKGSRVLVVDDVLATGGTAAAAGELVESIGSTVAGYAFVLELEALNGRQRLGTAVPVISLMTY